MYNGNGIIKVINPSHIFYISVSFQKVAYSIYFCFLWLARFRRIFRWRRWRNFAIQILIVIRLFIPCCKKQPFYFLFVFVFYHHFTFAGFIFYVNDITFAIRTLYFRNCIPGNCFTGFKRRLILILVFKNINFISECK